MKDLPSDDCVPGHREILYSLINYRKLESVKHSVEINLCTAWNVSVFVIFPVSIFPHSDVFHAVLAIKEKQIFGGNRSSPISQKFTNSWNFISLFNDFLSVKSPLGTIGFFTGKLLSIVRKFYFDKLITFVLIILISFISIIDKRQDVFLFAPE